MMRVAYITSGLNQTFVTNEIEAHWQAGWHILPLASCKRHHSENFSSRVVVVCDAHELPFSNETFDGVIIQAVLEHTCDPYQCVKEIYRVLKPDGLVYAETSFMQQVHIGRCDFTRFTHLGCLRLFRQFDVIDDGAVCGTGMALAWSYQGFLFSFVKSKWARALIILFTCYTAFWLKYFDYFLIDKPGTLDAASGYYLLGRKSQKTLSDKQLINLYRGIQQQSN